ncbi:MAG TPA: hypothetical protein VFB27_01110 [Opitutaceae bacterium]|nr:hypothetical protein [Opitutaceae bacterium]
MKCYYSNTEAVGTCKSCGRGLSREHATEYPRGLACKERCENDVQAIIAMIERNSKLSATSASLVRSNWISFLVSGLFFIFLGVGFLVAAEQRPGFDLGQYMGFAFIAYGCYTLFRAFKVRKASAAKSA